MKALKKTNEVIDFDARRGHNKGGEVDGGSVGSWFRVVPSSYTYSAPTILPHTIEFGCNCVTLFLSLAHIYILWYKSHSARLKPGWAHFGLRPSCTGRAGRPLLVRPPTHPKCKYNARNQSTILCSCDIYQCKKLSEFLVFQRFFSNGHCDKHTTLTWIWMTKNSDFSSFLFVVRLRGG